MSYNKKKLVSLFHDICENTSENRPDSYRRWKFLAGTGTRIKIQGEKGSFEGEVPEDAGKSLHITNGGVDSLVAFINELHQDEDFVTYVSSSGAEKYVTNALKTYFSGSKPGNIEEFLKQEILKPLRDSICYWTVYIPLCNINIDTELNLGNVSFVSKVKKECAIAKFLNEHEFGGETKEEQINQKKHTRHIIETLSSNYSTYAKVQCRSHSSNLQSVAEHSALRALNCIRSFLHCFYSYDQNASWGLLQEMTSGRTFHIGLNIDNHMIHPAAFSFGSTLFNLNKDRVKWLYKQAQLSVIQSILSSAPDKRNSLASAILDSLQALGQSMLAPTRDLRFLGRVIAIERLLIPKGMGTSVAERFADGLVFSLAKTQKNRLLINKQAKEIYDKRSRIVHNAEFSQVFLEEEQLVEIWAINIVIQAIDKYKAGYKHRDFCEEIFNKKY